ncbi:DUF1674 domain-containing protein [Amphiplicatus metriothermophilus]|uniref:DUF1674 domain-containing protein n=1 Tax=Amphiplicatus metriothermophilus TaxID=1519374 RepID=A0A239PWX6_9PROT|nr:DUF1674 domain-containing protein [Amphiplicatus metriothermophilus]MBB5519891.1 hypothetical protein [Amphiplicatus metriothermophilus]SNT74794.1 hypothetical protein SAMN06297382_2380 [Amphiplicatus metriothermophilus]
MIFLIRNFFRNELGAAPGKRLDRIARQALKEAARRRRAADPARLRSPCDGDGRLEPTRYGDWECGGRCSDF